MKKIDKMAMKKLIQVALYILNKAGGMDFYHLFKIMYFAEREHLAKYGNMITKEEYCALPYGPVPNILYKAMKGENEWVGMFGEAISKGDGEVECMLLPKMECDMDYLSKSNIEMLDKSYDANLGLSFEELKDKSHDSAWEDAFRQKHGSAISLVAIAEAENVSDDMLEYIKDQVELDACLR